MSVAVGKVLTYSTWLVIGVLRVARGGDQLNRAWLGEIPAEGYGLGALALLSGVAMLILAGQLARTQNPAAANVFRFTAIVLALLHLGLPLLLVVAHTILILSGHAEANGSYTLSLGTLGFAAVAYSVVAPWAVRKLRKAKW